jgi:selenocysteine-specific elongation factor
VRRQLSILATEEPAAQLSVFVTASGDLGQRREDLQARSGWEEERLLSALALAVDKNLVVDAGGVFIDAKRFADLKEVALREVADHHKREPLSRGLARETLRDRRFAHVAPEVFRAVFSALEKDGALVAEKDLIRRREHVLELSDADVAIRDRLNAVYERAQFEPPNLDEALQTAGAKAAQRTHSRKLLQLLLDQGNLVRVHGDLLFHKTAITELIARLKKFALEHPADPSLDVASFKELAGVSRKYAIPLLEFLDREKITRRVGDRRQILK